MSLNEIKLTPAVLINLYPKQLIESEAADLLLSKSELANSEQAVEVPMDVTRLAPIEKSWRALGNNRQQILVVVRYEESPFLPDAELGLLTNMLSACKLSMDDVSIINLQHYQDIQGKDILSHFKTKRALLFGVDPVEFGLPVSFPPFQVQNVGSAVFLYSPPLDAIAGDKLLKSKLWVSLQRLFSI